MSAIPDDGGPAFPMACDPEFTYWQGLSIRDWFAGMALITVNAPECAVAILRVSEKAGQFAEVTIAKACYDLADAMLAVRKGGQP